jgi:hypothetical protein
MSVTINGRVKQPILLLTRSNVHKEKYLKRSAKTPGNSHRVGVVEVSVRDCVPGEVVGVESLRGEPLATNRTRSSARFLARLLRLSPSSPAFCTLSADKTFSVFFCR